MRASISSIKPPELLGCLIDVRREHSELVPIGDRDLLGKVAGRDLAEMGLDLLDRLDQRP